MASADFEKRWNGYGLTTANILYYRPDHPTLLQSFLWQRHDLHPEFPELKKFLEFWRREIHGVLHSVVVAHSGLIAPQEFRAYGGEFHLN